MFTSILSFIKALTLEFLIGDQTRGETRMVVFFFFFFNIDCSHSLRPDEIKLWLTPNQSLVVVCTQATVPTAKRIIVHFHDNSQATRWNHSNSLDRIVRRLTENVSKSKYLDVY